MKILQVVHSLPSFNPAGTEIYTYNLSLELSKRHQVYIFSRACNPRQKEYQVNRQEINGMTVYLMNNTFRTCNSFEMYYENETIDAKFQELLDRIKPDIVHIQHLVFLSTGLIKRIRERNAPIVFTLHDYWLMCPKWHLLKEDLRPCEKLFTDNVDEECLVCLGEMLNIRRSTERAYFFSKKLLPPSLFRWLKKAYLAFVQNAFNNGLAIEKLKERVRRSKAILADIDFFLAPSEYLKNRFIEFGIPTGRIKLSRNGLNSSLFLDTRKTKSDKIRFAFIGTILPAKGLHILIEAFNKIKRRNADLKIYGRLHSYVGFEYYPPYLRKILKNKDNIRFMGEFNHSEVAGVFREIDVLVVPSIWLENSPLIIQEAFLSKTAVISSRIGGIPEFVNDGVNGLLFTPGDAQDLQEKIQYLIDNPDVIEKFKEHMPEVKSIEDNTREMEEIYRNLLYRKSYENREFS